MHDAHNVVTTTIPFCPCSNLETIGQRLWRDHQRMVARHGQRIIQPGKDTPAGMADRGCFAVNGLPGADDARAERLRHRLMPEAHAKYR
ncbi:hypothetical protein SRABI106_00475 [Rahnella aquatilis]|nr:hypothetical protein SRABI106_00475 [Rahnella aquatilis]